MMYTHVVLRGIDEYLQLPLTHMCVCTLEKPHRLPHAMAHTVPHAALRGPIPQHTLVLQHTVQYRISPAALLLQEVTGHQYTAFPVDHLLLSAHA